MNKIALVIAYFGKLRSDNDFWMKSIELNKDIDVLLFTDQRISPPHDNLKIIPFSFEKFVELIQSKFDFKIAIPQPYKLCDFRPAFGYIFAEYLSHYEFWGHCDNDVIFGNIRKFITDDLLDNFERILIRGHFTLYKNTPDVNNFFMKQINGLPDYREVFGNPQNYCFDEYAGTGKMWEQEKGDKLYQAILFDDININRHDFVAVHKKDQDKGKKCFIYSFENGSLFRVFLKDGQVGREEIMYVHFQKRNLKIATTASNYFTIIPNMYIDYTAQPSPDFLLAKASRKLFYPQYFRRKYNALKKRVKILCFKFN